LIPKKNQSAPSQSWDVLDEQENAFKVYTREEMDALKRANRKAFFSLSPWAIIGFQVAATLVMVLIWSFFANPQELKPYFFSAFVGGFIGFFPATLFALRLSVSKRQKNQNPGGQLAAVVSGEFIKIAVTIALFVWAALGIPDLQWIPLLVTYLVTLKCYWLAWFWR
jgi:ATP synthase protein I